MKQIKSLFIGIFVSGVLFFVPVLGFGQTPVESNYEVSLQLQIGANDGAKAAKASWLRPFCSRNLRKS